VKEVVFNQNYMTDAYVKNLFKEAGVRLRQYEGIADVKHHQAMGSVIGGLCGVDLNEIIV
jgi:deoxycytidylate deaminase